MLGPPDDVEPAALFRLLLQAPRPWCDVDEWRVVALTALERAGIEQVASRESRSASELARARHEIALCLHDRNGPVFSNPLEVGELKVHELWRLASAVSDGLRVCCPEYGYCGAMLWHQALLAGARAAPAIAGMVGSCVDEGMRRIIERPDRWFGLPLSELTDGHWMAYRAGRAYVHEQQAHES